MLRAASDGAVPRGASPPDGARAHHAAGPDDSGPDDVVERALAILEHDSRDWADRQNRLYTGMTKQGAGVDRGL